jgi:anti-sigma regulatory factor (Ser/Thr protein kinase)
MPPGPVPTFHRTLSRTVEHYVPIAGEVERFCAEHGVPRPAIFKVRLFLEEMVLNLIDHAVGSATDRIDVRIEVEPGRVVLVLEDDSNPFDPRSAPAFDRDRPLEARSSRGMGIHLVRSMADDVAYERIDGRNQLRVVVQR